MVLRLDHVQLAMPPGGEDAARAFYRDALGIEEVPKPPELAARGGCWFERGDLRVHLGVDAAFVPARKAHPAFVVGDLDLVVGGLRERGYQVDAAATGQAYADDPFGNRIELLQARPPV